MAISLAAEMAAAMILVAALAFWLGRLLLQQRMQMKEQGFQQELLLSQERLQVAQQETERLRGESLELRAALAESEQQVQQSWRESSRQQAELAALRDNLQRDADRRIALEAELDSQRQSCVGLQSRLAELETETRKEREHQAEKLALLTAAREQMTHEFQALASRILDENSQKFAEHNRTQIDSILQPLNTQLKDFRQKVEETYDKESQQRFSLAAEVKRLQCLNERISEDAINLTNALKGQNKVQGTWGEVILERLLERSGLTRGREYEVQSSLKDDSGQRFQPDVIIQLPEGKHIVVDSKVSLNAFANYFDADSDEAREQYLKLHINSIRGHIRGLNRKQYQDLHGLLSLDFVLLFIPVEAAFSAAIQADPELFNEAFEQQIVIVSPSTLLATLRTIHNIWRYEYQSRNAQEIARQAGNLYDKFVAFVGDLQDIGQRLSGTQKSWENAYNKLSEGKGNLIRRAENLRTLGARTSKKLDADVVERSLDDVDLQKLDATDVES